jgi:hypothetical protein
VMRCLNHLNSVHGEMGGYSEDGSVQYESRMGRTFESHWIFDATGLRNGDLFGEGRGDRFP